MASENVQEFNESNFQEQVVEADKPVLVDFWAEWCQPCRLLAPTIDQIADEFSDTIKVGKVDIDNNRDIAMKYQIASIPTVILFSGGEPKQKFIGLKSREELASAINETVGAS